MALLHMPLQQISETHLQALIDGSTPEALTIEYKRETYPGNDDGHAEFLADISSFANARGGDLVIGMEAIAGVPVNFAPLTIDLDAEQLRLEHMARASIEPRIVNLQLRPVPLSQGGAVLIVRAPWSYLMPHRVNYKKSRRFHVRSSAGKFEPSIDELRALFMHSADTIDRMRDFRDARVAFMKTSGAPVARSDAANLVLHIVPFSAFGTGDGISIEALATDVQRAIGLFAPPQTHSGMDWRSNFDGFLTMSAPAAENGSRGAYVQVFRSGAVEAVNGIGDREVSVWDLDEAIVLGTTRYAKGLHQIGAEPPYGVMVTVIGACGRGLASASAHFRERRHRMPIVDRDPLFFTEIILESLPSDIHEAAAALRPVLAQLWNAADHATVATIDVTGKYAPQRPF